MDPSGAGWSSGSTVVFGRDERHRASNFSNLVDSAFGAESAQFRDALGAKVGEPQTTNELKLPSSQPL